MIDFFYKWLPIFFGCHCRADRSFYYKGKKFPVCARCTGELAGIIVALAVGLFYRLSVYAAAAIMVPMLIDGTIQMLTRYESTNLKRFVTGALFGYGLMMLIILSTIWAFNFGVGLGKNIFNH